jgi:hypothetical protein
LTKRINLIFDSLLQGQKVIQQRDVACVHDWIEDYLKLQTWHAIETSININEVKALITSKSNKKNSEALTDYLRAALGHMLLSSLSAGFSFENEYEFLKRAYQIYIERNYHNATITAQLD